MTLTKEADQLHKQETLEVSLMGRFSLRAGETAVSLDTPSYQSLLAYLILHPQQAHSRQQLAFQFWPDSSESQARTNLRKAIYTIRQTLPNVDYFLECDRQSVQWQRGASCVVDVWKFETAVCQAQQTDTLSDQQTCMERAINAYHGDFLPSHYDDWVLAAREKLRHQYLNTLESLLQLYDNQRQYQQAIRLAQKLLREDPLHEAAYRRLIRLQSLDGNIAGALRTYHDCSTHLQRELGVPPSPATQETYKRLLKIKAPPEIPQPSRVPLVARNHAWTTLQTIWQQARSQQPQVVLLTGEAGIGKTRLAEELIDWTRRQGFLALTAVCYPSEKQLAYAPVAKWLRSESLQPIFHRLDKRFVKECSRLLPELQNQHPDLTVPDSLTESWQRQHFFSVLAQIILSLRQPFLLYIDDITWCDQDTLDWLHFLLHFETQSQILLLATARTEEIDPDHLLITWQQQLERDSKLTKVALERLDAGASACLAGHVLQKELDGQQAAHLFAETEGNPLFIVEMARSGLSSRLSPFQTRQLPPKVQVTIESRLNSLSPAAYELAQCAAVIGQAFTYQLLKHTSELDEEKLIRRLDELWQRRIVREREIDAYDFSHDKIRQVAYASLGQIRRRQLHQRVWQALEALHANNLDSMSGQIAKHCKASGHCQEAAAYYYRAAKTAHAVYANQDAVKYLKRAIDCFTKEEVAIQQQVEIYERLGDVLVTIGRYGEAENILKTAVHLTIDSINHARLLCKQGKVQITQQFCASASETYNNALHVLGAEPNEAHHRWWQTWLDIQLCRGDVFYYQAQLSALAAHIKELQSPIAEHGLPEQQCRFLKLQKMLVFHQKRFHLDAEDVALSRRILDLSRQIGSDYLEADSRFALGFTHLFAGSFNEAVIELSTALNQAMESGNIYLQDQCLSYLTVTYRSQRDVAQVAVSITQHKPITKRVGNPGYYGILKGNEAWLSYWNDDLDATMIHGLAALTAWETIPYPFKWVALWPLLAAVVAQNRITEAVDYAAQMLDPMQQLMEEDVTAVLQQAITAWNNDQPIAVRTHLKQALKLAQIHQYL